MTPSVTRRHLLASSLFVVLAGCSGVPGDASTAESQSETSEATATPTARPASESSTGPEPAGASAPSDDVSPTDREALDLREANVVDVSVTETSGRYRFAVTLYHDDDGEDGYADWWQVETLDGEQLGRRTLLHAHSTDPFTRSETIAVPAETRYVVVRGHDQTHGYGGQAMVVDLQTGDTMTVQQGAEPRAFTEFEFTG